MSETERIRDNYLAVLDRARRCGGESVKVVAVTKTFPASAIRAVHAAGCSAIGENYAQEMEAKIGGLRADASFGESLPEVHFIGRLQSNKIRQIAHLVSVWQSIDRDSVLEEVARRSPGARILIQVNATGEVVKGGCQPDQVEHLLGSAAQRGLRVEGLMTVGPTDANAQRTEAVFSQVARLAQQLGLQELSMGMTNDLEIAIGAGSTLIRVGSAIFGDRPPIT
ncbi:MAG: YggS family pyridoxal phosphate-dependent enzyme [Actinomycetes bacterium]